jgi:hypothetical protein
MTDYFISYSSERTKEGKMKAALIVTLALVLCLGSTLVEGNKRVVKCKTILGSVTISNIPSNAQTEKCRGQLYCYNYASNLVCEQPDDWNDSKQQFKSCCENAGFYYDSFYISD